MNVNQITWKDAFSHKYVILCLICGGSLLILGLAFVFIYFVLSSYTSSLHYFETIPTYVPAITLIINGIIVCILAKRHLRYFSLIKISGAFCLISALICVVTTVTTTVIHLNRLQTLQGCEYTPSSSTCICMTGSTIAGSNDPSVQVTEHSSHFTFQNIPNCDVVHGSLNTCLRALFGTSVFGILISIFTSMLVYQLMSHEKKKKYLEQLESRRRFHQNAFSHRRNHDPLAPPPFPILSYPPPHTLAAQGCSPFMDDMFYSAGGLINGANSGGRGGWMWPPPPPPPWDLIDYRSYYTPSYDNPTTSRPCQSSPGETGTLGGENNATHRSGLLSDTNGRTNDCTSNPETVPRGSTLFAWLLNRNRRQRNTSRRLLSRDRIQNHSIGSADCSGALVTENRYNLRSPNLYGPLPPPHSPPPPPLSPTLPPPHHPLLPVGHFSPLLVPLYPSYRSVVRNRSLARLNNRRTRSNDAIFHHLHSMAYAHPPPPPFLNGPPLLGSPQSLFAAWGPPPPYSQPSSLENLVTGHIDTTNNNNGHSRSNNGNGFSNQNSENNGSNGSNNHGSNRRHNQINSVPNVLVNSDGYDDSSKLSTPISERRMLCNAFSSDGITLTIGGPIVTTTPSKSSCIVEVHVPDDDDHHSHHVTSESKVMPFNTVPSKHKEDKLTSYQPNNQQNRQSFKSLSNIPINLSNNSNNKHFSSHQQDLTRSIDTIIYEQQSNVNEHKNFVLNESYLGKVDESILHHGDCKTTEKAVIYGASSDHDDLKADLITTPETLSSPIVISNFDLSSSTDSTSCNLTSTPSSSSGSHNLYTSSSLLDDSKSIGQLIDQDLRINMEHGQTNVGIGGNETINLKDKVNCKDAIYSKAAPFNLNGTVDITFDSRPTDLVTKNYLVTIKDDGEEVDDLSKKLSFSSDGSSKTPTINSLSTLNSNNKRNANNKETNCPETGSHQGNQVIGTNDKEIRQEVKYMQTQSLPNLSFATPVVVAVNQTTSPSHQASSESSSCQVTPQHGSKLGGYYRHPSSGNTSTSQDIADLELELDEEPLCFLPDLPYDGTQNFIVNQQSEHSVTPHYLDISASKIKPPTPFANNPPSESPESTISISRTINDNNNLIAPELCVQKQHKKSTPTIPTAVTVAPMNTPGDNIIVTIRSIQV